MSSRRSAFESRFTAALPILVVAIAAVLLWSGLTTGHEWGDDFASYVMQAESIPRGRPSKFVDANRFTIEHSSYAIGPVVYPWGFPVLLASVYAFFGLDMIALKSVAAVCYLLFILLLWSGFRRRHSGFWRIALLCLFAFNPTMLRFMDEILSDVPFLLVSTFAVLLIGRIVLDRRPLVSPAFDHLLLGAAIAVAFFIRTNGVLLLAALAIAQVLGPVMRGGRSNGRNLSVNLLPYVSFVILAAAWRAVLPEGDSSNVSILGQTSLAIIEHHIRPYIELPALFFDGVPHPSLVYAATIPLAVAGAIRRRRSDHHAIVYVMLTFALCVLWRPLQGLRYLFPILPFYLSFVLTGLETSESGADSKRIRRMALCRLPVALVLLYFGTESLSHALDNLAHGRVTRAGLFTEASRDMTSYIQKNVEPDATVVFFKPRAMRMITGRRSAMINTVGRLSAGDYLSMYRSAGARPDQISPAAVACLAESGTIRELHRNGDFVIYRVTESGADAVRRNGKCATRP